MGHSKRKDIPEKKQNEMKPWHQNKQETLVGWQTDSRAAMSLSQSSTNQIGSDEINEFTRIEIEVEMSLGMIQEIRDNASATKLSLPATWRPVKFLPASANFHR
jgi:hypothetical protein